MLSIQTLTFSCNSLSDESRKRPGTPLAQPATGFRQTQHPKPATCCRSCRFPSHWPTGMRWRLLDEVVDEAVNSSCLLALRFARCIRCRCYALSATVSNQPRRKHLRVTKPFSHRAHGLRWPADRMVTSAQISPCLCDKSGCLR